MDKHKDKIISKWNFHSCQVGHVAQVIAKTSRFQWWKRLRLKRKKNWHLIKKNQYEELLAETTFGPDSIH